MQLAHDDAFRAVDDECAILGHQRNIAVENFLFLDVANGLRAAVGVLVVNGQADSNFQWRGIRHPAFLALVHVILQLHGHRVATLVAERRRILVERAALVADHIAGLVRVSDHRRTAMPARGSQVMQPLQVSALALPIPDGIVHEFQLRHFAEIPDGKNGSEHGLQSAVVSLARQQVHLQKALIGLHLHFDQIGNLDRPLNFREVQTLAFPDMLVSIRHALPHPFLGSLEINRKAAGVPRFRMNARGEGPGWPSSRMQRRLPKACAHTTVGGLKRTVDTAGVTGLDLRS